MSRPVFKPLQRFPTYGGEVRRALRATDPEFAGFGEAYLTAVDPGLIKGWRLHHRMTLNLIVCVGSIRFVVIHGLSGKRASFSISPDEPDGYGRLTVPPGWWMAFGGASPGENVLLNLASIVHDPAEADTLPLDAFPWSWEGD